LTAPQAWRQLSGGLSRSPYRSPNRDARRRRVEQNLTVIASSSSRDSKVELALDSGICGPLWILHLNYATNIARRVISQTRSVAAQAARTISKQKRSDMH
jgi:hypothetical protein